VIQLSQQAHDYFATAKQDVERSQEYMRSVEAEMMAFTPRLEALGTEWSRIADGPEEATHSYRFSQAIAIDYLQRREKEQRAAIDENDALLAEVSKKLPAAVDPRAFNPTEHARNKFYVDDLKRSNLAIDRLERLLALHMQEAVVRLLALDTITAEWELGLVQGQAVTDRGKVAERYLAKRAPLLDARQAAFWQNAKETGYGSAESNAFSEELEKKYEDQIGPLCRQANDEDALFLPLFADRFQTLAERFKASYRRRFDDFQHTADRLFVDKSGAKAAIGAETQQWSLENAKLSSKLNLWGRGAIDGIQAGQMWFLGLTPSFYELSGNENPAMLPCRDWREQMPNDLETRFPALTIDVENRRIGLSLDFDKPPKISARQVAQGGRWPQDGP
jgi:hypothetical protein